MTEFTSSVEGWLVLKNTAETKTYELFCKGMTVKWVFDPNVIHLPSKAHYAYELQKRYLEFTITKAIVTDYTDFETFLTDIETMHDSGQFYYSFKRNAAGDLTKFDGTNNKIAVLLKTGLEYEKMSSGDSQVWVITRMILTQVA